jgi:uncharacterized protein DUF2330
MRRSLMVAGVGGLLVVLPAVPALACAALIGPNGSVQVERTTTLAAYVDGSEHYVTSFEFVGGGAEFGAIVPLPGIPSKVEKGGGWTLQRLLREIEGDEDDFALRAEAQFAAADVEILGEYDIDALDVTILRGGGDEVATWAREAGFTLSPDLPEVLDFYSERSPIFMAARYDLSAALERGQEVGEGTPVHLTIPTDDPWVPLRILGVGAGPRERIDADIFLLTEDRPAMLPAPNGHMDLQLSRRADALLLDDLRGDDGMAWVPRHAWLSYLRLDAPGGELTYDLAIAADGGQPSLIDAGLAATTAAAERTLPLLLAGALTVLVLAALLVLARTVGREAAA